MSTTRLLLTNHPKAVRRSGALTAAVVLAAAAGLAGTTAVEKASAATTCQLSSKDQQPGNGRPTYGLSLKATGVSCGKAVSITRGYHKCRSKTGYKCSKKVSGFKCSAKITSKTTTLFYAKYTCRAGSKSVTGTYQQNK